MLNVMGWMIFHLGKRDWNFLEFSGIFTFLGGADIQENVDIYSVWGPDQVFTNVYPSEYLKIHVWLLDTQ